MALRRSKRLSNVQKEVFKDIIFTITPAASDYYLESKIEKNGGKIQKTFTKKVNYVIATKVELAEKKLIAKIKNALDTPDCKVVDAEFVNKCISKSEIVDVEQYLLKPPSDEDKKTHSPVLPGKSTTKKSSNKKNEDEGEEEQKTKTTGKRKRASTSTKKEAEEKKETKKSKGKKITKDEEEDIDESKKKKGKKTAEEDDNAMDIDDDKETEKDVKEEDDEGGDEVIVKEIRKGRTVVDPNVPNSNNYHVYEDGDEIYDAILNQTNIANNNNKFYNLQVLKKDNSNNYFFWTRWGRVGEKGQFKLLNCPSKDSAISQFKAKFRDKTANSWDDRKNFVKKNKKYFLLERDYGVTEEEEEKIKNKEEEKIDIPDSTLDARVQDIIQLIFDISLMEQQMAEIGYNGN